ncbi:expressed unknown protein [Seminavis robusta]|uniref:Uncharacterized protein n=1 Tax=Seminavis robusta TaxID=568900 RepID=A0A9N8HBT0_9STRA|nr:expressed unknown protein [Seminavis robusta]|eukprot:Sro290_g109370.1 n/a (186) ;mRNA; r:55937-56494
MTHFLPLDDNIDMPTFFMATPSCPSSSELSSPPPLVCTADSYHSTDRMLSKNQDIFLPPLDSLEQYSQQGPSSSRRSPVSVMSNRRHSYLKSIPLPKTTLSVRVDSQRTLESAAPCTATSYYEQTPRALIVSVPFLPNPSELEQEGSLSCTSRALPRCRLSPKRHGGLPVRPKPRSAAALCPSLL